MQCTLTLQEGHAAENYAYTCVHEGGAGREGGGGIPCLIIFPVKPSVALFSHMPFFGYVDDNLDVSGHFERSTLAVMFIKCMTMSGLSFALPLEYAMHLWHCTCA